MFIAEIKLHSKKNNFVYIFGVNDRNKIISSQLSHVFCQIDLLNGTQVCVSGFMEPLSKASFQVASFYSIEINALFARKNDLVEGDKISFKIVNQIPKCRELCLEVDNQDDWEIVATNAEQIEMQMIDQIRLVNPKRSFPLWVNEFLHVFVRVECIKPNVDCAMLYDGTTLILGLKNDAKLKNGFANRNLKIKTSPNQKYDKKECLDDWNFSNSKNSMEKCAADLVQYCSLSLMDVEAFPGHVILEGPSASGVTKLAEKCAHSLDRRSKMFRKLFDCKTLNSKNLESVTKAFGHVFEECFANEPSILILDDLDQLCAAPSSSKQLTPGAEMHFVRLAKVLIKFLDCIKYERMKCLCIATCKNKSRIHSKLVSSQGRRYFTKCFAVPVLNAADRLEFLEQIVKLKDLKFENRSILEKLVEKSQGCVIGDLVHLIDKISTMKLGQSSETRAQIDLNDVDSALKDFKSINLHQTDVRDDESALRNWADFGGYRSLKFDLEKIFLWPSKYTKIYEKLNIKSTDGVLLYGPTGTGKTVLASLTAKMCNLNCIVVKGAELLSKYIGASEEAVRNTFHRARSVRPSMILFDEFDALAPRRGHDSTGVTDRVVNQLLTELDGVEPLDGVYIIATSSRPDLIDPAFLRPGRIGHHFYCGLPTTDERVQILLSLSKKLNFDAEKDANLTYLGSKTRGFSGADLKSILFTAQMLALYAVKDGRKEEIEVSNCGDMFKCFPEKDASTLENLFQKYDRFENRTKDESENVKIPQIQLEITRQNLEEAFSTIKPSVTESEILRFEYIRKMLESKFDDTSQGSIIDERMIGSRATLA